ncbi:hypothetical protein FVR03_13965 [Pontibacter qinzhouensis]|uniref:Uncharacterized protein n=1 Tax=Pontibacter qinzhouensis TaxID=2603253 RepID=A0A5C8K3M7_9BACT|nr:hypothetical protein [Pontibacter qinzhouensis]TXK44282.1 hypothetical protein FVR03_13965 [Pontibacter qinzhouensis]
MKQVLVFKTTVTNRRKVRQVKPILNKLMNTCEKWNFDLGDCDHILRVEAVSLQASAVIEHLALAGFSCEELAD